MSPLGRRRPRTVGSPSAVPSLEEIAERYGRFLYTIAYRLTGNHADTQDLVQEVFVRVQRGLATYQPGSLEGWLSTITTNAFLDDVRRRQRRPVVALADDAERVVPGAPAADVAADLERLPDHLQQALAQLPADFRVPVVLCDVVGHSYDEIATALGVPIGTVRSRIHRGRTQLRGLL